MKNLLEIIKQSQREFSEKLEHALENDGSLSRERYVRYLQMQYHLTNGVQKHFYTIASHRDFSAKKKFREFLIEFANVEEPHYAIAAKDLENMGEKVGETPFDVQLWWMYFDKLIFDRPLVRLGATCILENLGAGAKDVIAKIFTKSSYITPRNSRFFAIHRHDETLPHGDEIVQALEAADMNEKQMRDLEEGARVGMIMYMRMVEWVVKGS